MAEYQTSACKTVGKGGVGESGASQLLYHQVTGELEIVMVLRNVETSLCPNTGAVAVLLVNGEPVDHGKITDKGTAIQGLAKPGDHVVAIIHTMPLMNDIACIRLGELTVELDQCDLVT